MNKLAIVILVLIIGFLLFGCTQSGGKDNNLPITPNTGDAGGLVSGDQNTGILSGSGTGNGSGSAGGIESPISSCNTIIHEQLTTTTHDYNFETNTCGLQSNVFSQETWIKQIGGKTWFRSQSENMTAIQLTDRVAKTQTMYSKIAGSTQFTKQTFSIGAEELNYLNEFDTAFNLIRGSDCSCKFSDSLYTGEKGIINGLECYYLKRPITVVMDNQTGEPTTSISDCINLNYCEALSEKYYYKGCLVSETQVKPIDRIVPENLLTPPTDYVDQNTPSYPNNDNPSSSDGSNPNYPYGSSGDVGSGNPPNSSGGGTDSSPSACTRQCDAMQAVCQQNGQEVTSDGMGCYTPCTGENCGYERDCWYVCLSK
ncbi:MAG: hypothetical protein NTY48_04860 [Candidatus Diapherotrites archaeon]|nr:hypothetical protein [Candidatus Diapherotrites archaeon]